MLNEGERMSRTLLASVAALSLTATAHAQWTVTNLHPASSSGTAAYGTSGTQQVGPSIAGIYRASLWSGTGGGGRAPRVGAFAPPRGGAAGAGGGPPRPAGWAESGAGGSSAGRQVGSAADRGGVRRARFWTGTSASWVNLTPAGATFSIA